MITKEEAIQKFKDILVLKPAWRTLSKSQFVNHFAIFVSWCLRAALWKLERIIQEFFLSTAINESSIMAHAEDREYIPRKRTPANGTVTITNNGDTAVSIPLNTAFESSVQLGYMTQSALVVVAGASVDVEFSQLTKETIETTVQEEKSFYEILLEKSLTKKIAFYEVYVNEGDGYEKWAYCRLFQNSNPGDKIYDEFYTHGGQTGIRFGNEFLGTKLPVGTPVKIELMLTDGDTFLAENQELFVVGEILDNAGQAANLSAVTKDALANGGSRETTEEIRANLHYWPIYNEKLVWQDDYIFFIKRSISAGILWIKVWGEKEAEEAAGAPNIKFINKIFVSAYATNRLGLETEVITVLEGVNLLNRKFEWVEPTLTPFYVAITGKVNSSRNISDVSTAIIDALIANYGKDSATRKNNITVKDIYQIINDTGYFTDAGAYFDVVITGAITPTNLNEMIHIDDTGPTVTLTYL